ncbi:MAG TPA: universal stress protein [Fulvivirga sp.]|nr:universal stress protein [Fulvivirga sp.]
MFPFKRVLVALDLTEMDETLIAYTAYLNTIFDIEKLYFVHVAKSLELPERLLEKYPKLRAPADETIEGIIREKVDKQYKNNKKVEIKIEVREGNAEDRIMRLSDIKEVDLIVMGRKHNLKGSGMLPNRIARIGHCSLLTVPEKTDIKINKIMVPVDFSKNSQFAVEQGKIIAEKTKAELVIQNTYAVPSGYHTIGKSYEEFAQIMKEHAQEDAQKFIKDCGISEGKLSILLSLDDDNEPSNKIHAEAIKHKADLIIIASRGRTGLANILLGSVADKILQLKNQVPVLVVKNKKHNLGFLEALLRL